MALLNSTCDNFTGFDGGSPYVGTGHSLSSSSTAGRTGNGFLYGLTTGSSVETSVRADYRSVNARNIQFDIKIPSATTISTSGTHNLAHFWDDSYADVGFQLRFVGLSSGTQWQLRVTNTSATTIFTVPDRLVKDTWYTIKLQLTSTHIIVRIDGRLAARYATTTYASKYLGVTALGSFYGSVLTGDMYIDNVIVDINAAPSAETTDSAKLAAVWSQWKTNYVRADGCVIRPYPDGLNGSFAVWSDSVSEAISYAMQFAVQMNDQTTFDSVANWAYNNMRRGAQGLGTVPYLYSWHWDIETNTAYDQNSAHDADLDILKAYYWAHGRWGSGGSIDYLTRANNIASNLYDIVVTNGSLKYLPSDYAQSSSNPFELNPSYTDFVAMELAKRYTADNWAAVINGMYDVLEDVRDHVYSGQASACGLPPNWCKVSTTGTITDGSRSNPGRYSYEAFRLMFRLKEHFDDYGDTRASSLISSAKTHLTNEWNADSKINAEYEHDGTQVGNYEKTIFTFAAYQCLLMNDSGNSTAGTMYTNKLSGIYAATVEGHIYQDAPSSSSFSYFDLSWAIYGELMRQGVLKNFIPWRRVVVVL